jgi:DNA replication protein DnaC
VGKRHLAQALRHEVCRSSYDVLVHHQRPKLLQHLNGGRADGARERRLQLYMRPDVLILDELRPQALPPSAPKTGLTASPAIGP